MCKNYRFCSIPFNGFNLRQLAYNAFDRIVFTDWVLFSDAYTVFNILLYMNMTPKTKNFITDYILKTVYKTQCHNHYRHTDGGRTNGKPNDKTGESILPVKSYSFGYKCRYIQSV